MLLNHILRERFSFSFTIKLYDLRFEYVCSIEDMFDAINVYIIININYY